MATFKTADQILQGVDLHCGQIGQGKRGLQGDLESLLRTVAEFGDHTIAIKVVDKVNDHAEAYSEAPPVVKWLEKFGGITFTRDEDTGVVTSSWKGREFILDNFAEARKNPYFKGVKKTDPYSFDLNEALQALNTKANAAMKKSAKDTTAKVVIDTEQLKAMQSIIKSASAG